VEKEIKQNKNRGIIMLNKYTRTIFLMTVIIFLYFSVFVGYDTAIAFSCACLYLSAACLMHGITIAIDLIKGRGNDSQKSD
jgi:hypothetical protein